MLLQTAIFHSFLRLTFHCVYIYIYDIFIHLSTDGHLGCFRILAIVNSAAKNVGVHISFLISVFVFFKYIFRDGITGSDGSSI